MRNATEAKATEERKMIRISEKSVTLLGHINACATDKFNDDSTATVAWMYNISPMYREQTENFFELVKNGLIVVDEHGCPPFTNRWFVEITPAGLRVARIGR